MFLWSAGKGDRPFSAFTWEVLNACSAQLLRSETPLASFVKTTQDSYKENDSETEFCGKGMWARVSVRFRDVRVM